MSLSTKPAPRAASCFTRATARKVQRQLPRLPSKSAHPENIRREKPDFWIYIRIPKHNKKNLCVVRLSNRPHRTDSVLTYKHRFLANMFFSRATSISRKRDKASVEVEALIKNSHVRGGHKTDIYRDVIFSGNRWHILFSGFVENTEQIRFSHFVANNATLLPYPRHRKSEQIASSTQ
jgi:hypothetical protein